MSPSSIKALLALRQISQADMAAAIRKRGVECSKAELNQTIHGYRENADIRQAFADELGMPAAEIFDDEFSAVAALRRAS